MLTTHAKGLTRCSIHNFNLCMFSLFLVFIKSNFIGEKGYILFTEHLGKLKEDANSFTMILKGKSINA